MYCSQCGKEISDESKYCSFCGKPVRHIDSNTHKQQDPTSVASFHSKDNHNTIDRLIGGVSNASTRAKDIHGKIGQQGTHEYEFLHIPLDRLIGVSILSFGLYPVYWFYYNWMAIQRATGEKMRPFWRSIFYIFWSGRPFKLALTQAKQHGYRSSYEARFLSASLVVGILISYAIPENGPITFMDLIMYAATLTFIISPLVFAQRAVNWTGDKLDRAYKSNGLPEYGLVGIVLALFILGIIGYIL
jgi:endogenous inhibitor of DNA gyrase (YacG/DUF329 family)